jgi:hypothetical protein
MITDEQVERALDFLRDNAEDSAKARAHRIYLEEFRKSLKAQVMSEHLAEAIGAQERYAYNDIRYRNHLEALKQAVYDDERLRFLRGAAEAKIEAWRTMCSNQRANI